MGEGGGERERMGFGFWGLNFIPPTLILIRISI